MDSVYGTYCVKTDRYKTLIRIEKNHSGCSLKMVDLLSSLGKKSNI